MVTGININFKTGHRYLCEREYTTPPFLPQIYKKILSKIISKWIWGRCPQGGGGYNAFISPKEINMYDKKKLDELKDSIEHWEETSLKKALSSLPRSEERRVGKE